MSETKKLNVGDKFAHATVGNVADFSGKAFLKEVLGLTGAEMSLGTLTRVKLYRFSMHTKATRKFTSSFRERAHSKLMEILSLSLPALS